jgi:aspartate racemase
MSSTTNLGILTGISYVSGLDYFKGINEQCIAETPLEHLMSPNPSIVMVSVDCNKYVKFLMARAYDDVSDHLINGIDKLVSAGCDMLVIASNTGHIAVPAIERKFPALRILHIADCSGFYLKANGYINVGLVGTKPTMEEDYLKQRLTLHGIQTIVPEPTETRDEIYRIIIEELSYNNFLDSSRQKLVQIIENLRDRGAQACILGCTEIELLIKDGDVEGIELIPSAQLHIKTAAKVLLGQISIYDVLPP